MTYAGWLFDQPWNQQMTGVMTNTHYAIYPDLSHPDQTRLIYPHLQMNGEIFSPPAVRRENDHSSRGATQERPIDVLYIGNLVPEALDRGWRATASGGPMESIDADFCDIVADAAFAAPDHPLHVAVQLAMSHGGGMRPGFNLRLHMHLVENHIRHVIRRDAVTSFAKSDVRMCVVGKGWDGIPLGRNCELAPTTDYEGMFRLASRAKICVDASTYLNGVNDRVFSYAVNGAVCFTNASGYLRGAFDGNPGIRFYSLLSSHTWRNRIGPVLSAMGI